MKGGEVIELVSDLGGGKTAFVKGLARGMGITETVKSPSFTISTEYHAGDLTLDHFDFYRLSDPGIMRDELAELVNDPQAVIAVEWAEIVDDVLPTERLHITIRATGEESRQISCVYPENLSYLFNT